jgi:hypothetical protein
MEYPGDGGWVKGWWREMDDVRMGVGRINEVGGLGSVG